MRRLRDSHFVVVSAALHLGAGVAAVLLHPTSSPAANRVITVDIRRPEPPPAVAPSPPVRAPAPPQRTPPNPPPRRPTAPPARPPLRPATPPPAPPVAPPTPPPVTPPPPPRKVDLFNASALSAVVGTGAGAMTVPDARGRTVSAAHGGRDPNQRDALEDREHAKAVLGGFIAEARDKEGLSSGRNVAPRWREAERAVIAAFKPTPEVVTDDGALKNWLQDWANTRPQGGKTPRGLDDSASSAFLGNSTLGATQSDVPEHLRKRAEVEVVVAPDGSVSSARLVRRSGRRKFDAEALATVVEAVKKGGKLDGAQSMVSRWSVEAWVNVAPPSPAAGFTFDEVTGKVGANHPMKKSVQTKVALISLRARD